MPPFNLDGLIRGLTFAALALVVLGGVGGALIVLMVKGCQ